MPHATTSQYFNHPINNAAHPSTVDCTLISHADGSKLGGVDHFIKRSIKSLVDYYASRMVKENKCGKYTIEIGLNDSIGHPNIANRVVVIELTVL